VRIQNFIGVFPASGLLPAVILLLLFVSACSEPAAPTRLITPLFPSETPILPTATLMPPTATPWLVRDSASDKTIEPVATDVPLVYVPLAPEDWMFWPMDLQVSPAMREIYLRGQSNGLNPRAISIFGDCQSAPEEFLGYYANNLDAYVALPSELQETVDRFAESLTRSSPTSQPGTTAGALLWFGWPDGDFSNCLENENPAACELRNHRPAFVIINIGTHYETRNERYMRMLIEMLLEQGSIPIITFKADNREGNHAINLENAALITEYQIPYWNLWAAVDELPGHNLYIKKGQEYLGEIYLNEAAQDAQRWTALQVLNLVWRSIEN
jgi:hypothetical protein